MAQDIILYSAQMCADCQKLKEFLEAKGVEYELRDVRANETYAREVEAKTGKLGVPYLVIDGEWKKGYDAGKPFTEDFAKGLLKGSSSPAT